MKMLGRTVDRFGSPWLLALMILLYKDICGAWCFGLHVSFAKHRDQRRIGPVVQKMSISEHHDCNFMANEEKGEEELSLRDSSDWITSEFTLLNLPPIPTPDLDAETVATTCCRSLQWVDYPTPNAGLETCFEFFTWECREVVTARRGGDTVEQFCNYGLLSPALQPFMGAHRITIGEATLTPATNVRGALMSFPIVVHGAPVLAFQHPSGMNRTGVAEPPITNMVMRLEQQRRPPLRGCWLVKELLDVRYAFAGDMGNAHVGA